MSIYATLADDFYINVNLNTEMALPAGRETTLSFFERIRKQYSTMRNFYTRDNGDHVESMVDQVAKVGALTGDADT